MGWGWKEAYDWMTGQRQILLSTDPVPRASITLLSFLGHVIVVALILVARHSAGPQIVPKKFVVVQTISGSAHLAYSPANAKLTLPRVTSLHMPRRARAKRPPKSVSAGDSAGLQALRGRAKQATAGLMADFKFRHIYGFSPSDYQLAIQTSGVLPTIPAADLPPRFEQYLIVEVTIDTDGHVADARLVNGEATPKIEHTLISAIREFKYIPAKRNGSPIPCQVDIVIHIPS
jgi:TonB family protein